MNLSEPGSHDAEGIVTGGPADGIVTITAIPLDRLFVNAGVTQESFTSARKPVLERTGCKMEKILIRRELDPKKNAYPFFLQLSNQPNNPHEITQNFTNRPACSLLSLRRNRTF